MPGPIRAVPEKVKTLNNPVGASLLAIAVGQPTQVVKVLTPSRASSLPQGIGGVAK
ncbi:hypothetical protein EMIT0196MI5_10057 [Pseudomonas sp. IT-196MI5]